MNPVIYKYDLDYTWNITEGEAFSKNESLYDDVFLNSVHNKYNLLVDDNSTLLDAGGEGNESNIKYYHRYLFDFLYFVLIMVLMLEIVFGIIVDGFAGLRDD